jgi:integrase/recombinase XerD
VNRTWQAFLRRFDIEHYAVVAVMRRGRASALASAVPGLLLSALSRSSVWSSGLLFGPTLVGMKRGSVMTDKDGSAGAGGLAGYFAGFFEELSRSGYGTVRLGAHMELFTDLCQWTEREGITPAGLDSGQVAAFLADRRRRGRKDLISAAGARTLTGYLAGAGAIPGQRPVIPEGPAREVLERYRRYLEAERGLAEKTIERYAGIAARFAGSLERDGEISWQEVRARDVTRFLVRNCPQRRSGHAPEAVPVLRSFLRFCHLDGVIPSALDGAVPAAAGRRMSALPKGIPDGVDRLLTSCDRERPRGRRDYAILLLLARLGLRAGEVAAMTLDDIDWRRGELAVRGKARREEVLPLPGDVGGAIAGYLRSGRPEAGARSVFLRCYAPRQGLSSQGRIAHALLQPRSSHHGNDQMRTREATIIESYVSGDFMNTALRRALAPALGPG